MVDTGPYTHDGIPVAQLFTDLVDLANVGLAQTPDGTPAIAGVFHTYVEDCFAGETEVITRDGNRPIKDMAGETVTLLTGDPETRNSAGEWVDAEIREFGRQQIWEVELERFGKTKTIRTTAGHRWFVDRGETKKTRHEARTDELQARDRLSMVTAQTPRHIQPDRTGVAAGIIFGDGSKGTGGPNSSSFVVLYDAKAELLKWMPDSASVTYPASANGSPRVGCLPREWKDLPSLDESDDYLFGWLAGYFATDGSADGRNLRLSSTTREHLDFAQIVCERLGIPTNDITSQRRVAFGIDSTVYTLRFTCVPDGFLIRPHQADVWYSKKRYGYRIPWRVVSATPTNSVEPVYCAVVPDTHAFALAGGILTGNCCDALMLRVREWGPVNVGEFPLFAQEKKRCLPLTMTPRVVLSLRRPCAPTPDQHGNVAAADEIAFANKLLIDARALVCQVKSAWPTRLHEDYPGARIAYGAMTAQPVSGASECLGWDWEIMLEIKGCTCG